MSHEIAKGLRFFFWMRWVFVAACGFSLVVADRGYSTAEVHRLLLLQSLSPRTCRLQELWQAGSIVVAHGLHYSVTRQHVGSSQTRIEPVSPALAGRFLNTGPPGKSQGLRLKTVIRRS